MTSTIESILDAHSGEEFFEGVRIELALAQISIRADELTREAGLSRREIARRMGVSSPATVQRIAGGGVSCNATLETLMRFASACGYRVHVEFVPIATAAERDATGNADLAGPTDRNVIAMQGYRRAMDPRPCSLPASPTATARGRASASGAWPFEEACEAEAMAANG